MHRNRLKPCVASVRVPRSRLHSFILVLFVCRMNYKISERAATLSPSLTLAIDSKTKQLKAEGPGRGRLWCRRAGFFGAKHQSMASSPAHFEHTIITHGFGWSEYNGSAPA